MAGPGIPLWRQLQAAASVLAAVRAGESVTPALARVPGELRGAAQALSFHAMRNLGRAEALRRLLAKRPPPPQTDALLCTALALCWNAGERPYEDFTLVDQAVEAARKPDKSFLNACLRRFLRERAALVAQTDKDPVALWNHPQWWIERLKHDHPDQWQAILAASNATAPMTLRVNTRRWTREEARQVLPATEVGEHGLILDRPRGVEDIPGFAEGKVSVQDAGAQLAGQLLVKHLQGRRVLDACAAPGGKTAHILELADVDLLALDVDPRRCERIRDNLQRLGLTADVRAADAAQPQAWWDGTPFDAILLDAPCTASGIVRRHPDVRWLRRESDIAALALQQKRLLDALWPLLAPQATLVYCTCSVFRDEGERQVASFVENNSSAVLRPSPGHLLPQGGARAAGVRDNLQGDHDGFYYALLQKRGG